MAEAALHTLRGLARAGTPQHLEHVLADFAASLGAGHYAFEVIEREDPQASAPHQVWTCSHACDWWPDLAPALYALVDGPPKGLPGGEAFLAFGNPERPPQNPKATAPEQQGVRHGVAVAVEAIEPGTMVAGLALGFSDPRLPVGPAGALRGLAMHAAAMLLDTYMRLPRKCADVHLSSREIECLKWASAGKTSWETAAILSLRERTVNFHLANAFRKLEVNNKQAAVAQAILQRLI